VRPLSRTEGERYEDDFECCDNGCGSFAQRHARRGARSEYRCACAGATGKAMACCTKIVTANPGIGQCDKERAVFKCTGSRRYISPNGCGTITR